MFRLEWALYVRRLDLTVFRDSFFAINDTDFV